MYQFRPVYADTSYQSFIMTAFLPTLLIPPFILVVLRPITFSLLNILPAGPTPVIFALLVQYHATIPTVYQYRLLVSTSPSDNLTFSDKSLVYLLAAQLALSSLPGSAICALVGWFIGVAWRGDVGPEIWTSWRVPSWVTGSKQDRGGNFDELRRRLEGEGGSGSAVGGTEGEVRRRGFGTGILDQFRGAF